MVYIHSMGTRSTTLLIALPTSTYPGSSDLYRINQAIPPLPTSSYNHRRPDYAAEDTPNLALLLTDDSNAATGFQDVALSTDPNPAASLVQVTALPPAKTSPQAVLPKLPYHPQLNVLYLIPLFIALGVVLGAITAVILLKWRETRWRLLRTSTLLPGPPYVPPENDVEDRFLVHGYPSMEEVSLSAAATPSKTTIHGSRYIPKRTFVWRSHDATRPPYSQPNYTHTIVPSSDGEKFTVVTEEDPFLSTSPIVVRQSPKPSDDASLLQIRVSPPIRDPTRRDNLNRLEAQRTNLPKPFRRSMFDILKLRGPYLSVPSARQQYTVLTLDEDPSDDDPRRQARRANSLETTHPGSRSSFNTRRSLDGGFQISNKEDALGLLGSKGEKQDLANGSLILPKRSLLLEEGTLSSPIQGEEMKEPCKAIYNEDGLAREDEIEGEEDPDIYTKAPERHPRTPRRKVSRSGPSRRASAPDIHASVLPLSPPSLMSPPLERSLFFTSLSSSVSLASRANTLAATHFSPLRHVDNSPEFSLFPLPSKMANQTKKLRTKRPEPPLPYPSYPDHVHSQPTRRFSGSVGIKHQSVSPGSPRQKGSPTSVVHRESTTGIWSLGSLSPSSLAIALASSSSADMLDKVNDLVALGYTRQHTSMGRADGKVTASLAGSV